MGPWHDATLSTEAFKLAAIWLSLSPAFDCVFTTSQSTGKSDVENAEHPERPRLMSNNPDPVEIQKVVRTLRCIIHLPS